MSFLIMSNLRLPSEKKIESWINAAREKRNTRKKSN